MERGPLGPGSRGRDGRRRPRGQRSRDEPPGVSDFSQGPSGEPPRERLHAGRPLVIASIHRDTSELKELARTLGLRLVFEVWQNRVRPHPGTFLGRGKLQQLKAWLDEWNAGSVPRDWRWTGDHWVPEEDGGRSGGSGAAEEESTSWGGWRKSGAGGSPPFAEDEAPGVRDFQGDLLLILDEDVRPAVLFNLEERLGVEVWGRTRLILEIFSQHAHLKEARLQVELAQLRYDVPMVHEAIHRKRKGERPGFMGGGEYAVADYEDFIKRRMRTIRDELERVRHDRAVRRKQRRDRFYLVSLAGYTNAGKSSLLSALTGAEALQESALFSTLGTMTRRLQPSTFREEGEQATEGPEIGQEGDWMEGEGPRPVEGAPFVSYRRPILVTDTVGFIRALPSWLIEAFRATLEEIALADVVLLVADVSDPLEVLLDKIQVGLQELVHLDVTCPILLVLNKTDLVDSKEFERKKVHLAEQTAIRESWIVGVSAGRKHNLEQLLALVQQNLPPMVEYRVKVQGVDAGQRLIHRLQAWGEVKTVDYGAWMQVEGYCDPIYWKDLQKEAGVGGSRLERLS
jgi:GTPase